MWRRKQKDPLEEVNLLELAPIRIADSEEVKGRMVVIRPLPERSGFKGTVDKFLYLMSARRVRLDDRGAFVWELLDGDHTVGEIARQAREKFGEHVEPAEERVGKLVAVLRREGLVAYPGIDDVM